MADAGVAPPPPARVHRVDAVIRGSSPTCLRRSDEAVARFTREILTTQPSERSLARFRRDSPEFCGCARELSVMR